MPRETRRWRIGGQVQGVGFRPFVYREASARGLAGYVQNRSGEVLIEAGGPAGALDDLLDRLLHHAPPLARPRLIETDTIAPTPDRDFVIRPSAADDAPRIHLPPDYFTCDDCLAELADPGARRHRYPFINCTQCGPRYTLIRALPYDRPNTAMADFALCPACRVEYENPADRRFHAQPLACPDCGPTLTYREAGGDITGNEAALAACVQALRAGKVVAAKGIGGYHLLCDACNATAVARLRARKHRPHKPLAVLFPWAGEDGLAVLHRHAAPDAAEAAALTGPERPIVLVTLTPGHGLAPDIAPGLAEVGAMLPYSPLHHLLAADHGGPLVATSANRSGEPVLTDAEAVEQRLATVADAFLHHDRPILRPADDSVCRVIAGRPRRLRLGRGLAPLALDLPRPVACPTLAVGGHMKNTIALAWEDRLVVSPHIGELDSPRALAVFEQVIDDLCALYHVNPEQLVHDAHPDYASTRWARARAAARGLPTLAVHHHHAHAALLAAEYPQVARWLVFTWDGTGLGEDGHIQGGEALLGRPGAWQRVASLRPFRLPGGDRAGREPWRAAAALAWECGREWEPPEVDAALACAAWQRGLNTPTSTAVGRLFDACASLAGVLQQASHEAQGPMAWEALAAGHARTPATSLPLAIDAAGLLRIDWEPLVDLVQDNRLPLAQRSARMHDTLAETLVATARRLRTEHGAFAVGLSGGVFLNRRLSEGALARLHDEGFTAFLPEVVPYNDAGLCMGQVMEAAGREG